MVIDSRTGMIDNPAESFEELDPVARFAQGVSINLPVRFVGRALALVVQVVLARLLGPEAFGRYAVGWNILRMVETLGPFGMDKAVIRFAAEPGPNRRGTLLPALIATLAAGAAIGLGLWLLSPLLAIRVFGDPGLVVVLRWFAPGLGLAAGLFVGAAATRATQQMQYSAIGQDLAQPGINLLLIILVHVLGIGLAGYVLANVLSYLLSLLLTLAFLLRLYPDLKDGISGTLRPTLKFLRVASMIWLASLANVLINRLDRLILPIFRPAEVVGVYQAVVQFSALFPIILSAFNMAYLPILAARFSLGDTDELSALYRASTKWGVFVSLPAFVVLLVVPDALMATIYGPSFVGGNHLLRILMLGQLINVSTGGAGFTLIMTGRERSLAGIAWSALLVVLIANLSLVPRVGALGSALAAAMGQAVLHGAALLHVRRKLGLWPYDRALVKGVASALLAGIALVMLNAWIALPPLQTLLLSSGLVGVVYLGTMLLLGLDEDDRSFLRMVVQRVRR